MEKYQIDPIYPQPGRTLLVKFIVAAPPPPVYNSNQAAIALCYV